MSIDALQLKNTRYNLTPEGVALTVQLAMATTDAFDKLPLQQMRLHLTGEKYISQTLYIDLLHYLTRIDIQLLDKDGKPLPEQPGLPTLSMGSESVLPVGFAEQHALIPDPLNTFRGYRLLQEYFSFPDKFQFVDLTDFEWLDHCSEAVLKQAHGLELKFIIAKPSALELPVTADNIRLHCTPVVNLFKREADPISQDGKQDRYEVRPQQMDRRHCGVYSIDKVSSRDASLQNEEICVQFESFEHDHSSDADNPIAHYSVRQQPASNGPGLDTYLSFSPRHDLTLPVMSIELTCTNQDLPAQIPEGGICHPGPNTPKSLVFKNIVVPTRSYAPPTHKNYFWKLISNLSLNYLSLVSVNPLPIPRAARV